MISLIIQWHETKISKRCECEMISLLFNEKITFTYNSTYRLGFTFFEALEIITKVYN